MRGADKPKNQVVPHYSHVEANKRTDVFIAPGGPWKRLVIAKNNLVLLLDSLLQQGTSPYEGVTWSQSNGLLVGHCGLRGEFGNAIETMIEIHLDSEKAKEYGLKRLPSRTLDERMVKVVDSFASTSELCKLGDEERDIARKVGGFTMDAEGNPMENKIQALRRCATIVDNWLKENPDQPEDKKAAILENLAIYRAALPEVEAYATYAKEYLKCRQETHRPKSNDLGV